MKSRSEFHDVEGRREAARKNVSLIAPRLADVLRPGKYKNAENATKHAFDTSSLKSQKHTQSDFSRASRRPFARGHIDFQRGLAHEPSLSFSPCTPNTRKPLRKYYTRTYLRTHYGRNTVAQHVRARERTVWVGSCICGRGGGAYSCRVLIVNWFRSTRDSQVLSAEECFTAKKLSRER